MGGSQVHGEGGSASGGSVTAMYLTWGAGPREAHMAAPAGGPHSGSESELPAGDTRWSLAVWDSWRRRRNLQYIHTLLKHLQDLPHFAQALRRSIWQAGVVLETFTHRHKAEAYLRGRKQRARTPYTV